MSLKRRKGYQAITALVLFSIAQVGVQVGFAEPAPNSAVVIPQQFEQSIVAQQVVKHGAGVALADKPPFGQVTAAELRTAVDSVMKARAQYHEKAILLGESLRAAGGYQRAAEELIAFGQRK